MKYDQYRKFRQQTYQMLGKAKDATFELMEEWQARKARLLFPKIMLLLAFDEVHHGVFA